MSTRASAPRCASCGMPLAPDAEACAVCGARVPLIARSAPDEESGADEPLRPDGPAVSVAGAPGGHGPAPVPTFPGPFPAPLPASADVPGPPTDAQPVALPGVAVPAPRFDAAAAARDVRAASRPVAPGSGPSRRDAVAAGRGAWSGRGPGATAAAAVAPVGRCVLAYGVDLGVGVAAVLAGVLVGAAAGGRSLLVGAVLGLAVGVAQLVAEGVTGATLGARLLGLRTVDARTGSAPGVGRALVRQLVVALGLPVAGVGNWVVAASGAWDAGPRRRGWHDRAAGTAVVLHGAAAVPEGARAARRTEATSDPARPWTPTPPPAGPSVEDGETVHDLAPPAPAPVPVSAPQDLFPPPTVPAPVPAPVPVPDLVPAAPGAVASPVAAAPREPDLLPAPPEPSRRDRAERLPVAPAEELPDDPDLGDLEHTRVRDPGSLRRRTGTLALLFDTGERVRVVGRGLVGRGPRAEDGQDILHVVVLSDAARSLSRVHAEFGPEPAGAEGAAIWVADRGSTNGTVVVDPDGVARVLPAGTRAVVSAGWTVRLGDREARVEDD